MKKNRKAKKPRNMVVLGMLLTCKGGAFHDKRQERGGSKNKQVRYLNENY